MPVTNQQILDATHQQNESVLGAMQQQAESIAELDGKVDRLCVAQAKFGQWKTDHEKRTDGLNGALNKLRTRVNVQGTIIGVGEIIIAAIAFLRGGA